MACVMLLYSGYIGPLWLPLSSLYDDVLSHPLGTAVGLLPRFRLLTLSNLRHVVPVGGNL